MFECRCIIAECFLSRFYCLFFFLLRNIFLF
jgi:hypothetical protein